MINPEDALPDTAFAAVYQRVVKKNGRTSRAKVRKFPIHTRAAVKQSKVDIEGHMAPGGRANVEVIPRPFLEKAHAKIVAAAKKHGFTD